MPSYKEIQDSIKRMVDSKNSGEPLTAATGVDLTLNPRAGNGVIISAPGSEKVLLNTSTIRFMTCVAAGDFKKNRYCFVEVGIKPTYAGSFVDSNGDVANIVTKRVFDNVLDLVSAAGKQISKYKQELDYTVNERDTYKLTLDTLRSNGIID